MSVKISLLKRFCKTTIYSCLFHRGGASLWPQVSRYDLQNACTVKHGTSAQQWKRAMMATRMWQSFSFISIRPLGKTYFACCNEFEGINNHQLSGMCYNWKAAHLEPSLHTEGTQLQLKSFL